MIHITLPIDGVFTGQVCFASAATARHTLTIGLRRALHPKTCFATSCTVGSAIILRYAFSPKPLYMHSTLCRVCNAYPTAGRYACTKMIVMGILYTTVGILLACKIYCMLHVHVQYFAMQHSISLWFQHITAPDDSSFACYLQGFCSLLCSRHVMSHILPQRRRCHFILMVGSSK